MSFQHKIKPIADLLLVVGTVLFALTFPFAVKASVWGTWAFGGAALLYYFAYRRIYFRKAYIFPILFFVVRFTAFLLADDITVGRVDTYFSFLIIPIAFMLVDFERKANVVLKSIFYGYLAICTYIAIMFVVNTLHEGILVEVVKSPKVHNLMLAVPFTYWHPTYIASFLMFTVPLAFYLRFSAKVINTWLMYVGVVMALFCIYFTGARTGIIASLLLLLFTFIYYYRVLNVSTKIVSCALVLIIVSLSVFNATKLTSDPLRKEYLHLGINAIKEHPLKGSGLLSPKKYIERADADNGTTLAQHDYFHNQFIDDWAQFGIVGFLLLVAFWLYCVWMAFRRRDYLLASFIIIFLPFMMFDSPLGLLSSKGILSLTFWFCFLLTLNDGTGKKRLG